MQDKLKITGLVLLIIGLSANGLMGQNQVDSQTEVSDNKWGFIIEPYILFPNMGGNIGLRNLP